MSAAVPWAARCYAACQRVADRAEQRRGWVLGIGAPLMAGLLGAVAVWVLQSFPNSGDEFTYVYQAATMAEGRLSNPATPQPAYFETYYITRETTRTFGTFPFGWPLLLSLAMRGGLPVALLNPLVGVLTLWLLYDFARALYGARVAMLSVAVLGVSPFFVFNAASFFSHAWCGCLLLGAACCAIRAVRRHAAFALGVGLLVGWAVVARYLTGAVIGMAIVIWMWRQAPRRRWALLGLVVVGGAPWVAALAGYNAVLSGSPWELTTMPETVSLWFADGVMMRGPDILANQILAWLLWMPPTLALVYVLVLRRRGTAGGPPEFVWLLAIMAGVMLFYVNRGGNQYGPRFYYEATLFALPAIVARLFADRSFDDKPAPERRLWYAAMAGMACLPVMFAVHLANAWTIVRERQVPYEAVAQARLDHAIVLLAGRIGRRRSMDARDLVRNDFNFANPVLYARDPRGNPCALLESFPGRAIYRYVWNAREGRGALVRAGCGGGQVTSRRPTRP